MIDGYRSGMSRSSDCLTPAEFDKEVEVMVKFYMQNGQTRLEAIQSAIERLSAYIFEEGEPENDDWPTLYLLMGLLWFKLARTQSLEMQLPDARA